MRFWCGVTLAFRSLSYSRQGQTDKSRLCMDSCNGRWGGYLTNHTTHRSGMGRLLEQSYCPRMAQVHCNSLALTAHKTRRRMDRRIRMIVQFRCMFDGSDKAIEARSSCYRSIYSPLSGVEVDIDKESRRPLECNSADDDEVNE